MQSDDTVFRTVFVDREVDRALLAHTERLGASAGSVYRLFLESGLAQLKQGAQLPAADEGAAVLRTAHVGYAADVLLQGKAFRLRLAFDELSRRVTRLGMLAELAEPQRRPRQL